jgi:hypothetical protein
MPGLSRKRVQIMTLGVFADYRDRMLSIMADAEQKLGHQPPADSLMLDLARNRMARVLTAYHLFADRELFAPNMMRDPAQRIRTQVIAVECAALAEDFRAFTRDCILHPVIGRWASYRIDALAMMARIRQHLAAAEIEARAYPRPILQAPATIGYRTAA